MLLFGSGTKLGLGVLREPNGEDVVSLLANPDTKDWWDFKELSPTITGIAAMGALTLAIFVLAKAEAPGNLESKNENMENEEVKKIGAVMILD